MKRNRRNNLLKNAGRLGFDSLIAFEPENLFYMTGFWGEAACILEKGGGATIVAPELEVGRAREESVDCEVISFERGGPGGLISSLASRIGGMRACTDLQNHHTLVSLKKGATSHHDGRSEVVPTAEPFLAARAVKDEEEIRILRRASRIIDEMFGLCEREMRAGQRESELQATLMSYAVGRQMFDTGYHSTLNPLIVAGGPNDALPHAQVTERRFRRGELVVVDITLRYKGYVSDATRTFALGRAPARVLDAYEVVRESQALGLGAVRPRVACKVVDLACRRHIDEAGYGGHFVHSTGHGIGLEVHEPPAVSGGSSERLRKNMAITVEPGIYVQGKFGIRIEDSLLVRDGRPSVMHRFTKDLVTV